jgi:cytochrome c biogenesis protein CcmG/thiol:disulfide interchange protein DsbE
MKRPPTRCGLAVLTLALLAACSSPGSSAGQGDDTGVRAGPTTPSSEQIAQLRAAADLAPCPSPAGHPGASDLPAVELACLAGGPGVPVAGLVGTPYVVNFWASDCAPCKDEGPYLQAVYDDAGDAVGVLGVNFLDPGGDAGALAGAREFGMRFPILFDPEGLLGRTFDVPGLPVTFFVDADGMIVGQHIGAFDSADELREAIQRELGIWL